MRGRQRNKKYKNTVSHHHPCNLRLILIPFLLCSNICLTNLVAKHNGRKYVSMSSVAMNHLKEENDNLKCQLEAYKNEVDMLKSETHDTDATKDKQLKALQQALQGMQRVGEMLKDIVL